MNITEFIENKAFLNIVLTISILFLVFLILKTFRSYRYNIIKYNLVKLKTAMKPVNIDREALPYSNHSSKYSYSVWLFINDWKYNIGKPKHIFHVGDKDANVTNPGVWLDKFKNNIVIKVGTTSSIRYTDGKLGGPANKLCKFPYRFNYKKLGLPKPDNVTKVLEKLGLERGKTVNDTILVNSCESTIDNHSDTGYCPIKLDNNGYVEKLNDFGSCKPVSMNALTNFNFFCDKNLCTIENVPLNRWFHLAISLCECQMDVYLDGKLHTTWVPRVGSSILPSSTDCPNVYNGNLYVNNWEGYDGLISCLNMYPFCLTSHEVSILHSEGPLSCPFEYNFYKSPNYCGKKKINN